MRTDRSLSSRNNSWTHGKTPLRIQTGYALNALEYFTLSITASSFPSLCGHLEVIRVKRLSRLMSVVIRICFFSAFTKQHVVLIFLKNPAVVERSTIYNTVCGGRRVCQCVWLPHRYKTEESSWSTPFTYTTCQLVKYHENTVHWGEAL
jgi:hypothetical protein